MCNLGKILVLLASLAFLADAQWESLFTSAIEEAWRKRLVCPDIYDYEEPSYLITDKCNSYRFCQFGTSVEIFCEKNEVFDERARDCVDATLTTREECRKVEVKEEDIDPICVDPYGRRTTEIVTHQTDSCEAFYLCVDGEKSLMNCNVPEQDDYVYNDRLKVCEHKRLSTRWECRLMPKKRDTTQYEIVDQQQQPTEKKGFQPVLCNPSEPFHFGDHNRMANPYDCTSFFLCLKIRVEAGVILPEIRGCPNDQVFHPMKKVCVDRDVYPHCNTEEKEK